MAGLLAAAADEFFVRNRLELDFSLGITFSFVSFVRRAGTRLLCRTSSILRRRALRRLPLARWRVRIDAVSVALFAPCNNSQLIPRSESFLGKAGLIYCHKSVELRRTNASLASTMYTKEAISLPLLSCSDK